MSGDPPWSVHSTRPDDVTDVPCVVVDRPTVTSDVQHHVFTTPVVVIGRRDNTTDAQQELDDAAVRVAFLITGPDYAVTRIEPSTATVADQTYPSYTLTVSCGVTVCRENQP